ncbi:MAG TPA: sugar phosphate isomerase/epimerase [Acidimicrobiales bacterium]|nr:sugar phosphate isomerase/epimerase [Acidimicrobiales bacterium]
MELSFQTVNFSPVFGAEVPLPDVLAAASEAGFTRVGLDIWGVEVYLAEGGGPADLRCLLDDNGLSCTDVMALPVGPDIEHTLDRARRLAEIVALTDAHVCGVAFEQGVDPFANEARTTLSRCTDIVADAGARVALEYLPYSPLPRVAQARALCDDLGCQRAGLLVDSWHTLVGDQLPDISGIPAAAVTIIQFSDALTPLSGDLHDESRNLRRLPGEGNLRLGDFVQAIRDTGYAGLVSPEVLSTRVRQGSPLEFARSVRAAMTAYWE